MDIWIYSHDTQMANNIVKWWKTKFLNGYKQFSVECGDSKVSDTEELLGRINSEDDVNNRLRTNCTTPPIKSGSTGDANVKNTNNQLNFEEFTCDVSLEKNDKQQDREEFSFTLYDFDGHGKITKDDIAGLVTTIYEALGSSVKVPHYGSKTIKVKLTVSPDQRKHVSATIINRKKDDAKGIETKCKGRKMKNTKNNNNNNNINERRHYCCKYTNDNEEMQDHETHMTDDSDCMSRMSNTSDEDEVDCYNSEDLRNLKKNVTRKNKNDGENSVQQNVQVKNGNCIENINKKKRSGSLQRQELIEIIQANMEKKSSTGFQTARKHSNHISQESKHNHKNQKLSNSTFQYLADIVDPTHFYVDLASLQNTTNLNRSTCQYDKLIDAVMCVSNKKTTPKVNRCKKHAKNDATNTPTMPIKYQPLSNAGADEKKVKRSPKKEKTNRKNPQVVVGHTSSPHHLRHRNRQEDQARAMAQVVRWLEREFSSNLNMKDKKNFAHTTTKENNNKTSIPSALNSGIEKHEYHHVHEHIHHHYHHYQESPLVV